MRKKRKNVCATLKYIERFLVLTSTATVCVSISDFALLVGIPIGSMNSASGLKIYVLTAAIKSI